MDESQGVVPDWAVAAAAMMLLLALGAFGFLIAQACDSLVEMEAEDALAEIRQDADHDGFGQRAGDYDDTDPMVNPLATVLAIDPREFFNYCDWLLDDDCMAPP